MAIDTDGSLPALSYNWINTTTGLSLGGASSVALTTSTSAPSDIISCTITATDLDGETVDSTASVSVENSPPEITLISFSPASGITTADTVTCSAVCQ